MEAIEDCVYEGLAVPATFSDPKELEISECEESAAAGKGPEGDGSLERIVRASEGVMKESDSSKATDERV